LAVVTTNTDSTRSRELSESDAAVEWRSALTGNVGALLLFELVTGLLIYLAPFNEFTQFSALLHSLIGIAMLAPLIWYVVRHWRVRKKGVFSHFKLLGYVSLTGVAVCVASGLVLTWEGIFGPRINYGWSQVHLVAGVAFAVLLVAHLTIVSVNKRQSRASELLIARRAFYRWSFGGCASLMLVGIIWTILYQEAPLRTAFPDDYNWRFGEDRPFAPSMARLDYSEIEAELPVTNSMSTRN
jgi:hypothetical protein